MKKIIYLAIAAFGFKSANSQEQIILKTLDQQLPNWCIDANYKYGGLSQTISKPNVTKAFSQLVVNNIGNVKYMNGKSQGGDLGLGYFFGKNKIFGFGLGLQYLSQSADLQLDSFHVEYKNTGKFGDFRQIIKTDSSLSSNYVPRVVRESIAITNISIPILFKFKHKFNKNIGVTADLGGLLNMQLNNSYTTNAVFNYEAAYKADGSYDGGATIDAKDWLVTKQNFLHNNLNGNINSYFDEKNSAGYNVGLQKSPASSKGNVKENSFALGALFQAAFTYQLNYRISIMLGGYILSQMFEKSGTDNWKITEKVGEYSSITNGIKQTTASSYGLNFGIRYFIGGFSDIDGDGIADSKDDCLTKPGLEKFNGCPDSDGDGICDILDACPNEFGPVCTNGCPDRDNDCVDDKNDACPDELGSIAFHGCPDRDMDGIPDYMDLCPDDSGTKENKGCPFKELEKFATQVLQRDTTRIVSPNQGDTYLPPHIVLSTSIIHFDFGKSKMSKESDEKLNEAIEVLNKNPKVILYIGGYTDNIGSMPTNILLSYARAQSVREFLFTKGVAKDRIIISGNGKDNPINDNKTPEGRAKNRRIEMKLLLPL